MNKAFFLYIEKSILKSKKSNAKGVFSSMENISPNVELIIKSWSFTSFDLSHRLINELSPEEQLELAKVSDTFIKYMDNPSPEVLEIYSNPKVYDLTKDDFYDDDVMLDGEDNFLFDDGYDEDELEEEDEEGELDDDDMDESETEEEPLDLSYDLAENSNY